MKFNNNLIPNYLLNLKIYHEYFASSNVLNNQVNRNNDYF